MRSHCAAHCKLRARCVGNAEHWHWRMVLVQRVGKSVLPSLTSGRKGLFLKLFESSSRTKKKGSSTVDALGMVIKTPTGAVVSVTAKMNRMSATLHQRRRVLVSHAAAATFFVVNAILHQRHAKLANFQPMCPTSSHP
jgi:hypothetical protein